MFSQTTVEPFFPTLIWIRTLETALSTRLNNEYKTHFQQFISTSPGQRTVQTTQDLHRHPEFAELVSAIDLSAGEVLDHLGVEHRGFEISGCWANFGAPGVAHIAHHHANNYLSGVYYVDAPAGGNVITFHDPRFQVEQIVPGVRVRNAHNSTAHSVAVQSGQLILFPAWLVHSVPPNDSNEMRISISFNIIFSQFNQLVSPPRWAGTPFK